ALAGGNSLLPAGVAGVSGHFQRGDPVTVADTGGKVLATGLSRYSAAETRAIAGHRSDEIEDILGYPGRAVLIHRDDLVT
uniref:PUA domain-containing protein n=1 Tax=Roseovarius halophilus (ex Wu et al. 2025) TaxID=3376060 RepID=UPI00399C259C